MLNIDLELVDTITKYRKIRSFHSIGVVNRRWTWATHVL